MARSDRRIEERVDVKWPVVIYRPNGWSGVARTTNVSLRSVVYVSSDRYFRGERIRLKIQIGPNQTIECAAHVVREEPASLMRFAYGARITSFVGEDHELLVTRLQELRVGMHGPSFLDLPRVA